MNQNNNGSGEEEGGEADSLMETLDQVLREHPGVFREEAVRSYLANEDARNAWVAFQQEQADAAFARATQELLMSFLRNNPSLIRQAFQVDETGQSNVLLPKGSMSQRQKPTPSKKRPSKKAPKARNLKNKLGYLCRFCRKPKTKKTSKGKKPHDCKKRPEFKHVDPPPRNSDSESMSEEGPRGSYKCGRCGFYPKGGHTCAWQPDLKDPGHSKKISEEDSNEEMDEDQDEDQDSVEEDNVEEDEDMGEGPDDEPEDSSPGPPDHDGGNPPMISV